MIFVLDQTPLSFLANNTRRSAPIWRFSRGIFRLVSEGHIIAIPEIAYYECRRELVRANKSSSVQRLDELCSLFQARFTYVPISTEIIIEATKLWAWARQTGQQTAHDESLDADVILAATAITISSQYGLETYVVTRNIGHIERYTPAIDWSSITP